MTLSKSSMKWLKLNFYLLFYSILVFFTPLIYVNNTNELYEFPKMYFLYVISGFITAFFVSDRLILKKAKIKLPNKLISVFILSCIVSTVLSSHLYTSVWGYYTRFNGGLLSIIAYFCLYTVAINIFIKKDFVYLFRTILISSTLTSLLAIYQHFTGIERVYSTIGQPNWLAHYFSMIIPLALLFYFSTKRNFDIWYLIFSLGFASLWFTYSLSGFISLFFGLIALTYVLIRKSDIRIRFKKVLLAVGIVIVICFLFPGLFTSKIHDFFLDFKKFKITMSVPVYALEDEYQVSDPGSIRFGLWRSTLNLIFSSPKIFLVGSGLETFPYVFQCYRSSELNYTSEWDYVFNKPHNYYLELWAETGLLGLSAYLAMLTYIIFKSPKFIKPSLIAFSIGNIFGWPTTTPALLFWLLASMSEYEKNT